MPDEKYFDDYSKSFWSIFAYSKDIVYLKDSNLRFQVISREFMQLMGVADHTEVLGKNSQELHDLPGLLQFGQQFTEQDLAVKDSRKNLIFLDVINYNGEIRTMIVCKTPIYSPHTNNFVGLRGHIGHLISPNIIKTLLTLHKIKGLLVNHNNHKKEFHKYQLNEMQHMVLYLCINNYSYSEIAMLLSAFGFNITPTRVNDYIDQLKIIFRVSTKTQLTEKALGLDLHTYLPAGLLKLGSLDISEQSLCVI